MRLLQTHLESLGRLWVEGEITEFTAHMGRHWYFTLRDDTQNALLNVTMFFSSNRQQDWMPAVGDRIQVNGSFSLYRGQMKMIAYRMKPVGEGNLEAQLNQLREKLAKEGLFDHERKKEIPTFPRVIGIATSRNSAAMQDILKVLQNRLPSVQLVVAHCGTEGASSAPEIIRALQMLEHFGNCDVILMGRGGGSKASLMGFNDEQLVRTVADCSVPIVCGVGHESDHSLCDLAADQRAATPTHAAELVSRWSDMDIATRFKDYQEQLLHVILQQIAQKREVLEQMRPKSPKDILQTQYLRLHNLKRALQEKMQLQLHLQQSELHQQIAKLEALNPNQVLQRGFSVVRSVSAIDTDVIMDATQVQQGQYLQIQLANGKLIVKVDKVIHPGDWEQLSIL